MKTCHACSSPNHIIKECKFIKTQKPKRDPKLQKHLFIKQNCSFISYKLDFNKICSLNKIVHFISHILDSNKICSLDKIVHFISHKLDFKKNKQICLLDKIIK